MIRLLRWFPRHPPTPTTDAVRARDLAEDHKAAADRIYTERARLLGENNFARRIGQLYEGRQ